MKTALATKDENREIISHIENETQLAVDGFSDEKLFRYMREVPRITAAVLQPLCASFIARFKKARSIGDKTFCGYKEFNRAAQNLVGYTGRQVRNLAAGTPTPVKKATVKPLPAAEKKFRADAKALQEKVDVAVEAASRTKTLSNLESQLNSVGLAKPTVKDDGPSLATAILLLREVAFADGIRAVIGKKIHVAITDFLVAHNSLQVPPPKPTVKTAKQVAKEAEDKLKSEPSQAKHVPKPSEFVADGSMTIGHMVSVNAKGTAPEIEFVTAAQHEELQRGTGVV
jgi:hypothetical protein